MKRIEKISLIVLVTIICLAGVVNAASSCNISLETAKSEFNKNEEFTVDVKISNIQSERGFIAFEANLEYTKDSLTLIRMKGQNEWSNPIKDLSYNASTGKIVIDKDGLAKSDEVILKLTFKVNENSKKNARVALNNIKVSDATVPTRIDVAYKNITIKEGNDTPTPTPPTDPEQPSNPTPTDPEQPSNPTPTDPEQPSNPTPTDPEKPSNPTPTNPEQPNTPKPTTPEQSKTPQITNNNNANMATGEIPQTGNDNRILMLCTSIAIITGVVFYIRVKRVNREMGN